MLPPKSLKMRNGNPVREGVNLKSLNIFMHFSNLSFNALECGVGKKWVHCKEKLIVKKKAHNHRENNHRDGDADKDFENFHRVVGKMI